MKKRIVLIEDDQPSSLAISHRLIDDDPGAWIYHIFDQDGFSSIKDADTKDIDIIIMDLYMGSMKPDETYRETKRIFPEVPIIVHTSAPSQTPSKVFSDPYFVAVVDKLAGAAELINLICAGGNSGASSENSDVETALHQLINKRYDF